VDHAEPKQLGDREMSFAMGNTAPRSAEAHREGNRPVLPVSPSQSDQQHEAEVGALNMIGGGIR
jgi:hypothetical protein